MKTNSLVVAALCALSLACGGGAKTDPNTSPATPVVGTPLQTACMKSALSDDSQSTSIELATAGDTLTVRDRDTEFNCCLPAHMEATVQGEEIVVVELEDPDISKACDCVCHFELSVSISQLEAGTYNVKVYKGAVSPETLLYSGTADVTGATQSPIVGGSLQSRCLSQDSESSQSDSVELFTSGGALTIRDRDTVFNCCLPAHMEVTLDGQEITVVEVEDPDQSQACDCECHFELSVTISQLAAGTHNVRVYKGSVAPASQLYAGTVSITG